jgi:HPP family
MHPMQIERNIPAARFLAEVLVVGYMGAVALAAHLTGIYLLLFPELAALSHDVMTRPQGKWASQPWRIVLTPTLTAIVGLFVTRNESYGAISVALVVTASLLIIKLLRSAIGPAISAGALPMVLNERSWMYPAAIFVGLVGLVAALWIWQRYGSFDTPSKYSTNDSRVIDALETYPHDRFWVVTLLTFVLALGIPAQLTGLRFILFPPLIVMAYELFGHPEIPGWMARPALFPLVCVLTASIGVIACHLFRSSVVGVMLTVLCSIAILRAFKVHMPPALAVGLLPFVMTAPNIRYPTSVGIGTVALTLCFWGRGSIRRSFTRIARRIGSVNEWQARSQSEELR